MNTFKILFCDDELTLSEIIIMNLKNSGYNIISCDNGKKAIEIIKEQKIDLLLIDYFMPDFTGEDTIKEIRTFNKELLIILQTAYSGEKPALEMLKNLDIQGYHDKSDGVDKLILQIETSFKILQQSKEIEETKMNLKLLKEEITDSILNSIKRPLQTILLSLSSINDCTAYLKETLGQDNFSLSKSHKAVDKINTESYNLRAQRLIIEDISNTLQDLLNKKNLNVPNNFTVKEFTNKIKDITSEYLRKKQCYLNLNSKLDDITIKGNMSNLIQVVTSIILNIVETYMNEDVIDFFVNEKNNNIVFTFKDYSKQLNIDIETEKSVIEDFNGEIWIEKDNSTVCFYIPFEENKIKALV